MTQETRTVFGFSPGPPDSGRPFVFLEVIGEITNGMLAPLRDPRVEFPTHGNVYLDVENWIPQAGIGAVWRVRRNRQADPGTRQAEYSVIARGQQAPLEIVSSPTGVTDPDGIREQLILGIELGYPVSSSILFQLADGSVVGPIRCEGSNSDEGLFCKAESFNDPLGHWKHTSSLLPITFFLHNRRRTYTAYAVLPDPEAFYDCAKLDHASKTTLRLLRETSPKGVDFTNKQLENLSRLLSSLSVPNKLFSRIERVRTALDKAAVSRLELDSFRQYLLDQPSIQVELEALREDTRLSERERVSKEKTALTNAIASLKKKQDELQRNVESLSGEAVAAEADLKAVLDKLSAAVEDRVAEIRKSPAELLTDVVVLQPFLSPTQARPSQVTRLRSLEAVGEVSPLLADSALQSLLVVKLTEAGLVGGSAKRLSREVLAAAYAGQITTFTGSLASVLATACAAAFAGRTSYEYRVPIGLLDGEDFEGCLSVVLAKTAIGDDLGALIVQGINRSASEAYADSLRAIVSRRQLNPSGETSDVVLLATLARGPSALSLPPDQCELGPVIDTDVLSLSSRVTPEMAAGGSIRRIDWRDWRLNLSQVGLSAVSPEEFERAAEGEESLLWRRTVRNAYQYLSALPAGVESTPLESLAVGWLIPRAYYSRISRTSLEAGMVAVSSGNASPDPRIPRLIKKLFPPNR